jgi:hypothetical protein
MKRTFVSSGETMSSRTHEACKDIHPSKFYAFSGHSKRQIISNKKLYYYILSYRTKIIWYSIVSKSEHTSKVFFLWETSCPVERYIGILKWNMEYWICRSVAFRFWGYIVLLLKSTTTFCPFFNDTLFSCRATNYFLGKWHIISRPTTF